MKDYDNKSKEAIKKMLNSQIISMARNMEFRQDKKESMEEIQSYMELLKKI